MSPDNQMQDAGNPKQKLIVVIAIIIFLVIGWQLIGLFGGGSKAPTSEPIVAKTSAPAGSSRMPQQPGSVNSAAPAAEENPVPQPVPLQTNAELAKLQQETEAKYIAAVNELQMLKLQREIAEVNQALAASKLSTMTTEKSISDLLVTKSVMQAPEETFNSNPVSPKNMPQRQPASAEGTPSYVLLSVSQQGVSWSAVIGNGAKRYSVSVGDILPADASVVLSINENSVVIEKDGKKKKLNLSNSF